MTHHTPRLNRPTSRAQRDVRRACAVLAAGAVLIGVISLGESVFKNKPSPATAAGPDTQSGRGRRDVDDGLHRHCPARWTPRLPPLPPRSSRKTIRTSRATSHGRGIDRVQARQARASTRRLGSRGHVSAAGADRQRLSQRLGQRSVRQRHVRSGQQAADRQGPVRRWPGRS